MATIIAGRFGQQEQAQDAIAELEIAGFPRDAIASMFVNPAGQHDLYPLGGDVDKSPGTFTAGGGAVSGLSVGAGVGAAVSLATLPILGPAAALAGAAVGAYVGSFSGALGQMHDDVSSQDGPAATRKRVESEPRKSGMLVAISTVESERRTSAIRILQARGAADIEQADGTIAAGQWADFNPLTPISLVA